MSRARTRQEGRRVERAERRLRGMCVADINVGDAGKGSRKTCDGEPPGFFARGSC